MAITTLKGWKAGMIKKRFIWIMIVILVALEQGIKLLINKSYLDADVPIISPLIYFNPMFNRDYSWFNSMLQLNIGKWMHILTVTVMLLLLFSFYRFLASRMETGKIIDLLFAFIFSGAFCSLIDKVLWNGSLDYILIKGFFTFDLKDVYINIFNFALVLMVIVDYKGVRRADEGKIIKEFIESIIKR